MSRQEDFKQAAYNNDKESSKTEQQFFIEGCEHGYQYAIEKACQYLYDWNKKQAEKHGSKAVLGIREFTISVSDFRKAMED